MARAKQTNRAEARRRHRQMMAEGAAEAESRDESEPAEGGSDAGTRGGGRPAPAGNSGRPSLGASFREAYHPAHYREDLRALPGLITLTQPARIPLTRTVIGVPWFLVSAFLVILGFVGLLVSAPSAVSVIPGASASPTAAVATAGPTASISPSAAETTGPTASATVAGSPGASGATETPTASGTPSPSTPGSSGGAIGALLFQLLSLPPGGPTLPILLVGFMATRASYLQGFLIGLLDLVLVGLYVAFAPAAQATGNVTDILFSAAATGLPTSVLFAAAAAWYRRFLSLSSPRRAAPPRGGGRGRPSGRPAARR